MNKLIHVALIGVAISQLHGCAAVAVGTGTAVAIDRRTASVYLGDQEIELRAQSRLSEAMPKKAGKTSVTSYNRQVLITGQVLDEAARTQAGEIVKGVPDVRNVFNELSIAGAASMTSEANDTGITSKVKTRLLRDESVPGTKVKVVTEAAVVYLMGLVTQNEGKAATEVARTTEGVSKVVILFEYID